MSQAVQAKSGGKCCCGLAWHSASMHSLLLDMPDLQLHSIEHTLVAYTAVQVHVRNTVCLPSKRQAWCSCANLSTAIMTILPQLTCSLANTS